MIFNCLGIYYVTYSRSTAPCKKMPCVIYRCTAVTVLVLKARINAELMVGNTAAWTSKALLTFYTRYKVFQMLFIFKNSVSFFLFFFLYSHLSDGHGESRAEGDPHLTWVTSPETITWRSSITYGSLSSSLWRSGHLTLCYSEHLFWEWTADIHSAFGKLAS